MINKVRINEYEISAFFMDLLIFFAFFSICFVNTSLLMAVCVEGEVERGRWGVVGAYKHTNKHVKYKMSVKVQYRTLRRTSTINK